ncbi:hypothetical protein [Photorhabdus laumondii]|uniref:Uncharacterized protein n=1 Tax=Photorhabdus laumondii subsp. clarkei TaxID=2029685 RepID=A0A329VAN2_9GAMM|nr:hypothetical protein [Photorhabdus laumondii]RAW83237.1 hypothetical protein CKY01_21380 [Photorhabdus laumondii subsp. clarkei]
MDFFASRGFPIVVNFNYGTSFKGALDDVSGAIDLLLPILEQHGLKERTLEITFDFRNPVHSIVTSGHKEMGAPWLTGIEW